MPTQVCIAIGNHRSLVGIKEIIYTVRSALSKDFSVRTTREVRSDSLNIVIDEFSSQFDLSVIKKTKELYPNTKIVIVATEFVTPVSVLGLRLPATFNFFGSAWDWLRLSIDIFQPLIGYRPSYMRRRCRGFAAALRYCDLLVVVHPQILPTVAKLVEQLAPHLQEPLPVYPQIGPLSVVQLNRLWNLPVGFTMTGTQTRFRNQIMRSLVRTFANAGRLAPPYKHTGFESPPTLSADKLAAADSQNYLCDYHSVEPDYLFNINPPQTAKWRFSSPMRILRAILLGQIPVVTKKFHDHLLEEVARCWDGRPDAAMEFKTLQFLDRRPWLTDYIRTIEAYDRLAEKANEPFVNAMMALAQDVRDDDSLALRARTGAAANLSGTGDGE
jgi:hypothetical protein